MFRTLVGFHAQVLVTAVLQSVFDAFVEEVLHQTVVNEGLVQTDDWKADHPRNLKAAETRIKNYGYLNRTEMAKNVVEKVEEEQIIAGVAHFERRANCLWA